jgi:hypothetical protein
MYWYICKPINILKWTHTDVATSAVIFPAAVNATEAQQQFLLGNVRVQRSMVLADMYIILPLGLEGAFTFNAVATTLQ